jgi:hypothetical protein
MQARIIGVRQELSFEDGESANYMLMELPSGVRIQAPIDDDTIQALTSSFVTSGTEAAARAVAQAQAPVQQADPSAPVAHPALTNPMKSNGGEKVASDYTPLHIQDEEEYEFGGDYRGPNTTGDTEDLEVAQLQQNFRQASERVYQAAATGGLVSAAAELSKPAAPMPVPEWASDEKRPPERTHLRSKVQTSLATVTVEPDARGNPVLKGAGLVDPLDLTNSTTEQGEAAQI